LWYFWSQMAGGSDHRELALRILRDAPVAIVVLDLQGRIEHVNPFFERLTGYRLDEVRGQDWFDTVLPERERERSRAMFLRTPEGERGRLAMRAITTRSGEELSIECTDELLRDDDGKAARVLIIGHDVTDRVRIEAHLHRAQAMARIGSWERDLATGQTWWSDELFRLLGLEPGTSDPSFEAFLSVVHPEDRAALVAAFERGRAKGEDW
jgi:PAS domain S-box-containing protein